MSPTATRDVMSPHGHPGLCHIATLTLVLVIAVVMVPNMTVKQALVPCLIAALREITLLTALPQWGFVYFHVPLKVVFMHISGVASTKQVPYKLEFMS